MHAMRTMHQLSGIFDMRKENLSDLTDTLFFNNNQIIKLTIFFKWLDNVEFLIDFRRWIVEL